MLRLEDFMEIQKLHHDGVSVSEIARSLDLDRKTVRKYLRQAPREYERKPKSGRSILSRPYLRERWELGVRNAAKLFGEIRKRGYERLSDASEDGSARPGEAKTRSGRSSASRPHPGSRRRWTGATSATGAASGCTALR